MKNHAVKSIGCLLFALFSVQVFAAETIVVTVKTNEQNAAAIGYTVDNTQYGALGKKYIGIGPKNKAYRFGYRKDSVFGQDIDCGVLFLTENSTVVLIKQDQTCLSILD